MSALSGSPGPAGRDTLLAPDSCLLLVVDVQNDFCHEDGAKAGLGRATESARAIVPNIRALLDAAGVAGVPRVIAKVEHSRFTDDAAWVERRLTTGSAERVARAGTWGAELYGIDPGDADFVVTKHRNSVFAFTPFPLVLRATAARAVVIAGVQTDVCVLASARDAMQNGVVPVVVSDATATEEQAAHEAALRDIAGHMGYAATTAELLALWGPTETAR